MLPEPIAVCLIEARQTLIAIHYRILSRFDCAKRRVALQEIAPGCDIAWHHDGRLYGLDREIVRVHVPILTNPDVELQVSHHDCRCVPGDAWFFDNSFPHRLRNRGREARVHLVLDLEVNEFVRGLVPASLHAQAELRRSCGERCRSWSDRWTELALRTTARLEKRRRRSLVVTACENPGHHAMPAGSAAGDASLVAMTR